MRVNERIENRGQDIQVPITAFTKSLIIKEKHTVVIRESMNTDPPFDYYNLTHESSRAVPVGSKKLSHISVWAIGKKRPTKKRLRKTIVNR